MRSCDLRPEMLRFASDLKLFVGAKVALSSFVAQITIAVNNLETYLLLLLPWFLSNCSLFSVFTLHSCFPFSFHINCSISLNLALQKRLFDLNWVYSSRHVTLSPIMFVIDSTTVTFGKLNTRLDLVLIHSTCSTCSFTMSSY